MGMGWMSGRSRSPRRPARRAVSRIALIGGSLPLTSVLWKVAVEPVAAAFVENKWTLVWCGMGTGVAGAIAKRVLEQGGQAEALVIERDPPPQLPRTAKQTVVADLHERNRVLLSSTHGVLAVPGGIGTLMELVMFAACRQAGDYLNEVVIYDCGAWSKSLRDAVTQMSHDGAIAPTRRDVWSVTDDIATAVELLTDAKSAKPIGAKPPVKLPPAPKLRDELVARAPDSVAAFRCLTVAEKRALFAIPERPTNLPAFVVAVHQPPTRPVRVEALLDPDHEVRLAAAAHASTAVIRAVFARLSRSARTDYEQIDQWWKSNLAPTKPSDSVLWQWLGSLDADVRTLIAEHVQMARHRYRNGDTQTDPVELLERLGASKDPRSLRNVETATLSGEDIATALAWGAPWPLFLLLRHPACPREARIAGVAKLMTAVSHDASKVRVDGIMVCDEIVRVANECQDEPLIARVRRWMLPSKRSSSTGVVINEDE